MTKRTCSIEGCESRHLARGLCRKHLDRFYRLGTTELPSPSRICKVEGCERRLVAHALCAHHYYRQRKYGDPLGSRPSWPTVCKIEGCEMKVYGRGWCSKHYGRWRKNGDPLIKRNRWDALDPNPVTRICTACKLELPVGSFYWRKDARRPQSWCKACSRLAKYNLNAAQHDAMLARQGGGCAICGSFPAGAVDHDHATGKVRGLLCAQCNVGIGMFQEDLSRLAAAITYLTSSKEVGQPIAP